MIVRRATGLLAVVWYQADALPSRRLRACRKLFAGSQRRKASFGRRCETGGRCHPKFSVDVCNLPNPENRITRTSLTRLLLWACFYVAIAAAFIGANPLRGETTGPFDVLASYPGWNPQGEKVEVRNPERSDILDALVPGWMESRRQIREGVVPLWNPLPAGGHAALLDPSNAQLTVGFALFAAAPDPALGFYLSVLACMVIAGLGMHLLVARHYSTWPSVFAGISYMACGFITAWLFWPHTHTAIWVPWLLLAVSHFAARASLRGFIGIAGFTALLLLGGFPYVVALGLGAAFVYACVGIAMQEGKPDLRRLAGVLAGIAAGAALVAIPLLTLWAGISATDLSYRHGGSPFTLATHAKLLSMPWAGRSPQVEGNMYVGMAALLFAVAGLGRLVVRRRDALAWTGVVLVAVGVILVFGLLPRAIGAHLPVLSNNPWNRAILLLDIGIILLAASGMDWLMRYVKRGPQLLLLGALICAIQGVDLGKQFRRFNGPTPSRYFYPVGEELALLKDRIRPFQYVGQDSSYFLHSGTLGAVGLGEWFGHAMRSSQLHNLLDAMADEPFSSPTSTAIVVSDFHWPGDLSDAVALCYAVFPSSTGGREVHARSKGRQLVPLAPINNLSVAQAVRLPKSFNLTAISVKLATYRATGLDGEVTASLRVAGGREVTSARLPAAKVLDNHMATFKFAGPRIEAGDYDLVLKYVPGPKNLNLTAWVLKDVPGHVRRGGEIVPGSLNYIFFGPLDGSLAILTDGHGVAVAENSGCAGGAYWTAGLTESFANRGTGGARLLRYRPHHFVIQSTAPSAGFVVVPMQYQKGWQARVNGRDATIRLAKGVLPAVAVPAGTSELTFVYRPPYWRVGLAITAIVILLLASLRVLRKRKRRDPGGSI